MDYRDDNDRGMSMVLSGKAPKDAKKNGYHLNGKQD